MSRLHKNKLCENNNCNIQDCPLRHPKFCRYLGKFKHCKFGTFCWFRHYGIEATEREPRKYDEEIDNLKSKIDDYDSKIKEKEKEIKILDKMLSETICELERLRNIAIENIHLKSKVEALQEQLKETNKRMRIW